MSEAFKAWLKEAIVQGSKLLAEQAKAPAATPVAHGLTNPTCPSCGDTPSAGDGSWRLNSDRWQHRCGTSHPQAGHDDMGPSIPAPDDAAAIEAARKAIDEASGIRHTITLGGSFHKGLIAYHAEQSKRDAATIAELRRQLERQAVEIEDLKSHAREWEEQAQLAARPAPGEVPELTESEIAEAWDNAGSAGEWAMLRDRSREDITDTVNACIRASFAKMPGREAFDFAAWWEKNKPKSSMTTYSHAFELCRDAIKAAGIPAKE